MYYTTEANPYPDKYKRVLLDETKFVDMANGYYADPLTENAVIGPPHIIQDAIDYGNRLYASEIVGIENPDPSNYPEYLALRIRGEVPKGIQYLDELTIFDPRFHQSANTVLLSPLHRSIEDIHSELNSDKMAHVTGRLPTLSIVESMGEDGLIDLSYAGDSRFIGVKYLIELGHKYSEKAGVVPKYGGHIFMSRENSPHGTFGLSSMYLVMDTFDQDIVDDFEADVTTHGQHTQPDEFGTVKADDEGNSRGITYVRAWWD